MHNMSDYHPICHNNMAIFIVNPGQKCIRYCYANFVNGVFKAFDNIVPCFFYSDNNGEANCTEVPGWNSLLS